MDLGARCHGSNRQQFDGSGFISGWVYISEQECDSFERELQQTVLPDGISSRTTQLKAGCDSGHSPVDFREHGGTKQRWDCRLEFYCGWKQRFRRTHLRDTIKLYSSEPGLCSQQLMGLETLHVP